MIEQASYVYDAAPAINLGRRDQQEDAIAIDFAEGADFGFIVLADGMGGHSAGDVASKIVVSEVFAKLKRLVNEPELLEQHIGRIMQRAVSDANASVAKVAGRSPEARGMGSTLTVPIVFENRLYWISVGDSPLYLLRGSRLFRLNEEHSLANRMNKLVAQGLLDPEVALSHPDRHCLTSVLVGGSIPEVDCRSKPIELQENDIVLAASDGLQFIGEQTIARTVYQARNLPSSDIGSRLLQSIADLNDPEQDNVSLCVLKVRKKAPLGPKPAVRTGHGHSVRPVAAFQSRQTAGAPGSRRQEAGQR